MKACTRTIIGRAVTAPRRIRSTCRSAVGGRLLIAGSVLLRGWPRSRWHCGSGFWLPCRGRFRRCAGWSWNAARRSASIIATSAHVPLTFAARVRKSPPPRCSGRWRVSGGPAGCPPGPSCAGSSPAPPSPGINAVRTLAAHRYDLDAGELSMTEQLLDSCTIAGGERLRARDCDAGRVLCRAGRVALSRAPPLDTVAAVPQSRAGPPPARVQAAGGRAVPRDGRARASRRHCATCSPLPRGSR